MTDLCREFGISRKTGYKIQARYKEQSVVGLYDEKRTPERIPHRTPEEIVKQVVALRRRHPTWGPRKLRAWLSDHQRDVRWPAPSTIGDLLKKENLSAPRRRRGRVEPSESLLSTPTQPNDLWCIDYKGQFRLGNGRYCYPLTLTDAHSRYLLVCEGMERIDGDQAWEAIELVFRRFGLPATIRSDNGSPLASRGVCAISRRGDRLADVDGPQQTERGPVTPTADVWALGLIAFFGLTGKPFWRAANKGTECVDDRPHKPPSMASPTRRSRLARSETAFARPIRRPKVYAPKCALPVLSSIGKVSDGSPVGRANDRHRRMASRGRPRRLDVGMRRCAFPGDRRRGTRRSGGVLHVGAVPIEGWYESGARCRPLRQ